MARLWNVLAAGCGVVGCAGVPLIVVLLLIPVPPPKAPDRLNYSLQQAIEQHDLRGVVEALGKGADPNGTAYTLKRSYLPGLLGILDQRVDPYGPMIKLSALYAQTDGSTEIAGKLLEAGADPNRNNGGDTALGVAASLGNLRMMTLLIEHGAEVNRCGSSSQTTPLTNAAQAQRIDAARYLISRGADVNWQSKDGQTALIRSVYGPSTDMAKLLIAHGANVNARTPNGWTALATAEYLHKDDAARYLASVGGTR